MMDWPRLQEAIDLLTTKGEFLNRISRHNAYEFVVAVADVCDAASFLASLVEPCGECDADGEIDWDDSNATKPDAFGSDPCPVCGGVGVNPAARVVEEFRRGFNEFEPSPTDKGEDIFPLRIEAGLRRILET